MAKYPQCSNSPKLLLCRKNTVQGYLAAETGDFNLYARPIPKYDQSFASYLNVTYDSGHKLALPRWEIGVSPIRCRINKSSKPLLKIDKIIFTKI